MQTLLAHLKMYKFVKKNIFIILIIWFNTEKLNTVGELLNLKQFQESRKINYGNSFAKSFGPQFRHNISKSSLYLNILYIAHIILIGMHSFTVLYRFNFYAYTEKLSNWNNSAYS